MSRRIRLIGVLALSWVAASSAAAAPVAPAVVGPVVLNDGSYLARRGLIERSPSAPRLISVPALRGWAADGQLMPTTPGRVALFGRNLWLYQGPDPLHLKVSSWGLGFSRDVGTAVVMPDGGFLQVADSFGAGNLARFEPDGTLRWSIRPPSIPDTGPVPQPPVATGARGIVYATGGRAAVLDDRTGAVIAPIAGLPPYTGPPVTAPDGTLRVVDPSQGTTLVAYGPGGGRLWARPLGTDSATTPSVGPDGTTYLGAWSGGGGRIGSGEVVAVAADGTVRWRAPIGRRPARPTIDGRGIVWTHTIDGNVFGIGQDGTLRFRRHVTAPTSSHAEAVYAVGDDVLVSVGSSTVRLTSRPARPTPTPVGLRVSPSQMRLRSAPTACVAPPAGGPRSCLYRLDSGGSVVVHAPADGSLRLEVRTARGRLITRLGPYRVLAGENRVRLHGNDGDVCNLFHPCLIPPGGYEVRARIPIGAGRARWISAPFTVLRSRGRILY